MKQDQPYIRVLQVIGAMNRAGAETVLMNLHRSIDTSRVQFDYLVHTDTPCDYDAEIAKLGGTIHRIPAFRIINTRSYRKAVRDFFAVHAHEYDIVHGHIGMCAPIYLDEARKCGLATIAHSHSVTPKRSLQYAVFRTYARPVASVAEEFLACSRPAGIERFGQGIVDDKHFHVMPNGIRVADFACNAKEHIQAKHGLGYSESPVIVHVGRFSARKNHHFLLQVFAGLRKDVVDAQLFLVGRGPLEQAIKQQAEELGIQDAVHFQGVQNDVVRYLQAADCFVFPSPLEGLGMAVVEAQAAGAACVVSHGIPDEAIISQSVTRLSLDNHASWIDAIKAALAHPPNREQGASDVRAAGFDIADVAQWLAGFYEELATRKGN